MLKASRQTLITNSYRVRVHPLLSSQPPCHVARWNCRVAATSSGSTCSMQQQHRAEYGPLACLLCPKYHGDGTAMSMSSILSRILLLYTRTISTHFFTQQHDAPFHTGLPRLCLGHVRFRDTLAWHADTNDTTTLIIGSSFYTKIDPPPGLDKRDCVGGTHAEANVDRTGHYWSDWSKVSGCQFTGDSSGDSSISIDTSQTITMEVSLNFDPGLSSASSIAKNINADGGLNLGFSWGKSKTTGVSYRCNIPAHSVGSVWQRNLIGWADTAQRRCSMGCACQIPLSSHATHTALIISHVDIIKAAKKPVFPKVMHELNPNHILFFVLVKCNSKLSNMFEAREYHKVDARQTAPRTQG
ncbi:hypothetical protein HBI55_200020 [Parastagonospora nodorum]|nr:hypothetical protein HBI45_088640 [Parastagonospora nodorum]KAH6485435.1 hypothetical protein HBI55_200020 [Parastagonospora nodorum]